MAPFVKQILDKSIAKIIAIADSMFSDNRAILARWKICWLLLSPSPMLEEYWCTALTATTATVPAVVQTEEQDHQKKYEDMAVRLEKCFTLYFLEGVTIEDKWIRLCDENYSLIKIVNDHKLNCCRIIFQGDNQQFLCDNLIAIETELKVVFASNSDHNITEI